MRGNKYEGLNWSKCLGELMVLMRGLGAGAVLNEGSIGGDECCNAASSDISLATSAITCSTGTLVVPSGS